MMEGWILVSFVVFFGAIIITIRSGRAIFSPDAALQQQLQETERKLEQAMKENQRLRVQLSAAVNFINTVKDTVLHQRETLAQMSESVANIEAACAKEPGNEPGRS